MRTRDELKRLQSLSLEDKITLTKLRIQEFYEAMGVVYVSFSGGKDSTVLLHIVRELYPEVKGVFFNTGLEFPEVVQHVKSFDNVEMLRPEKTFKQVIDEYGWTWPSKEVSEKIYYARNGSDWANKRFDGLNKDGSESSLYNNLYGKWKPLVNNAPFKINDKCCEVMKKSLSTKYQTKSKTAPILATMASESKLRLTSWRRTGCNVTDGKHPKSAPMSFWTEQDVLQYILDYNIKIPSVYGEIVKDKRGKLRTTGEDRTGCIFCLCGCHLEKADNRRFIRLAHTHPKLYDYCMNKLGMKEILDYIQEFTGCQDLYLK